MPPPPGELHQGGARAFRDAGGGRDLLHGRGDIFEHSVGVCVDNRRGWRAPCHRFLHGRSADRRQQKALAASKRSRADGCGMNELAECHQPINIRSESRSSDCGFTRSGHTITVSRRRKASFVRPWCGTSRVLRCRFSKTVRRACHGAPSPDSTRRAHRRRWTPPRSVRGRL
jgi:hypothetical protein